MSRERTPEGLAAVLVAAVAFLPFLRGTLSGGAFYFRDLSLTFFPLRRFALDGLLRGDVRLWNPLVHQGIPLSLPALGYPVDLLQLLSPNESFLSLVLALHVPLGALAFFALARGLRTEVVAAAGGALVYALGGFYLACLNLYILLQAAAWAPLVVLGLVRLLEGGGRAALAGTALALGVALSTTGVEIVAQAIVVALVLGLRAERWSARRAGAAALAFVLALALAAPVLLLVSGQVAGSARAQGFPTDVVLSQSVHPFGLLQVVVGGLFGNLHDLANDWWGDNFFPRGFPYVLSLYLGAAVVALATIGGVSGSPLSGRLLLVAALGLVASLGRFAGLAALVDVLPPVHYFRFPVKAFFTVHMAVSLLVALGLAALAQGRRWKTLAAVAAVFGGVLAAAPLVASLVPHRAAAFAAAFLPPRIAADDRLPVLGRVLGDAAAGGLVAIGAAALAVLAARKALVAPRAAWLLVALVSADLLRTGAGLNPMVSGRFYRPSPELEALLPALRAGRVFTCRIEASAAYGSARRARARDHETLTFAAMLETLTPDFNVALGVPTAMSPDRTMLVPTERVLTHEESSCRDLAGILPRLRGAGVTDVLSLDPLEHADLEPLASYAPARIAPLTVHAYRLRDPTPRLELAGPGTVSASRSDPGRLELAVQADSATLLLVHGAPSPGWTARVEGRPEPVSAHGARLAVAVPRGRSTVALEYRPRALPAAWLTSLLALAAVALVARSRTPAGPEAR